jgi:hypothetical protein
MTVFPVTLAHFKLMHFFMILLWVVVLVVGGNRRDFTRAVGLLCKVPFVGLVNAT